jgi:predicted nucleic acid-binding protein
MSAAFVVDCSIAMAWLFNDEATPETAALLRRLVTETALVPAWWFIEITNVLAMAERKGRITRGSRMPLSPTSASSELNGTMKLPIAHFHIS